MSLQSVLLLSEIEDLKTSYSDRLIETASGLSVDDEKLELKGTVLHLHSYVEEHHYHNQIDLADIWMPGSGGFEHPVPLLIYPHHAQTVITAVDDFAGSVGHTPTFTQVGCPSVLANTVKFIEWALLNDHYQLQSLSKQNISQLCDDLKIGGIPNLLRLPQRLDAAWQVIQHDTQRIMDISHLSSGYINSLNTSVLTKMIGTYSIEGQVPNWLYKKVAQRLRDVGVKQSKSFTSRGLVNLNQPAAKTLNILFGQWNTLAQQEEGDRITFLPFKNPYQLSQDYGAEPKRTANLHVDDVVRMLGESHRWLYEISPLLVKVVRDLSELRNTPPKKNTKYSNLSSKYLSGIVIPKHLESSAVLDEIEEIAGIKISRKSANKRGSANDDEWTLCECIVALMTTCYIVLQIYNARRQAEIQDPIIGVSKAEHFRCADENFGWYQACFFNEKHGERYWYTLNQGSAKAFQVLFDLSEAWDTKGYAGLFNVPIFSFDEQNHCKCYSFCFNKGKGSRLNGAKFLEHVLGDRAQFVNGTQVFRRIYAVIYHYQYDNSELLALCHQLGHVDPKVTEVYVTDPDARDVHEQLHHRVKLTNTVQMESTILINEESKALQKAIDEVDKEKTAEDIVSLLMGTEKMAGRYTAFLKRIFKVLRGSVRFNKQTQKRHNATFAELSPQLQSKEMVEVIYNRGHRHQPKPHNNCHRNPDIPRSHKAPCSPLECKGCAYQDVKQIHLDIMTEDMIELRQIAANRDDYMPLERLQAKEQADNLAQVVAQHERTMAFNHAQFAGE